MWFVSKAWYDSVMTTISIDEIQRDLLRCIRRVQAGETLVILQANKPVAELKPIATERHERPFGLCAGEFCVPDDFDDPLPKEIIRQFEGS